jgi:hypothetical protein
MAVMSPRPNTIHSNKKLYFNLSPLLRTPDTRPMVMELIRFAGDRWGQDENGFGAKNSTNRTIAPKNQNRGSISVEHRVAVMVYVRRA